MYVPITRTSFSVDANCSSVCRHTNLVLLPYVIGLEKWCDFIEERRNFIDHLPIVDRRKSVEFLFLPCNNLIERTSIVFIVGIYMVHLSPGERVNESSCRFSHISYSFI